MELTIIQCSRSVVNFFEPRIKDQLHVARCDLAIVLSQRNVFARQLNHDSVGRFCCYSLSVKAAFIHIFMYIYT